MGHCALIKTMQLNCLIFKLRNIYSSFLMSNDGMLSSHLTKILKNTGKSVLAKWEWSTGKVQVEDKRI